jgi:hypothetical protein
MEFQARKYLFRKHGFRLFRAQELRHVAEFIIS